MKKLVMLSAIALALAGMLSIVACGGRGGGGGSTSVIKTSALETAIRDAETEKFGVQEAIDKAEVAKGVYWVNKYQMTAFNDAIIKAKVVRDNPVSQVLVDTEEAILTRATENFIAAKQEGDATPVTLKGTITVKYGGALVPFVEITVHSMYWAWLKTTRLVSPAENAPWEITTMALTQDTDIFFHVTGYADNKYEKPIFALSVEGLTRELHDTDISGITINMGNLNLITLSGTINGSFGGKTVPSVTIDVGRKSDDFRFGRTYVQYLGDNTNTPWSIPIPVLEEETHLHFHICGFDTAYGWDDDATLFTFYNQDFGVKVKDQDVGNIALTFKPVILSGTIDVTYDNKPVPSVTLTAWSLAEWNGVSNDGFYSGWLNSTDFIPGAWSIMLPSFYEETSVRLSIDGYNNGIHLFGWGEVWEPDEEWNFFVKPVDGAVVKVKDTDVSGIHLNLGNIDPEPDESEETDD
jgi:hypothetical protein